LENIFKNMDPEKRDRIINSAMEEFSKNTFKKASTNNIVKNANISKGLLYHYFSSKKGLYVFLESFAIETMIDAILQNIDWEESDIFERIKQVILIKLGVMKRYPHIISFTNAILEERTLDEIKELAKSYSPEIYSQIFYKNIDVSRFKDDIDVEKAINVIQWTIEKYIEEYVKHRKKHVDIDYRSLADGVNEYLKMLKIAFYK